MSQRKGERMRKDQRGFTIVELLIAVAILAIVVASVCSFILVGSRSYASANSDISVQQEAQLALNQMSDVLIDTTRSVNYAGYNASGNAVLALKDSEFGFEPVAKSLIMYNGAPVVTAPASPGGTPTTTIEPGNGNKHYHFYWDKTEETLYYTELDVQPDDVDAENNINVRFPAFGDPGWVVLAEHVTEFEVDLTQVEEKRVVQLNLTFVNGNREYNTSNNVTIRNKVAVNDAEIGPLDRSKTISVVPKELSVILEPGETYHFSTPKVTGQNVTDKSVTWSMGPGYVGSSSFSDAANGILQIATDEPAGSFLVVITTNAADQDGNHAQAQVMVNVKRVSTVSLGIPGNSDNIVEAGNEFTVTATVGGVCLGVTCDGCGDPVDKDFDVVHTGAVDNWEVVEGAEYVTVEETAVKTAKFKVTSAAEDGATIRIRATSYLSTVKPYDKVWGELVLKVKGGENAEPLKGMLQYGDETLIKEIVGDLPTTGHEYVTCVRVVDNSGQMPDKILLYFTIGHGADYRIIPDMFDLDLSGSYTFYMQAMDPVSKENHENGNHHQADSHEQIWNEYINNLSKTKPYGYEGDRYEYNKVYYSVLDRPTAIWEYNGVRYKGRDIVYDPVNIYTVAKSGTIIGNVEPVEYENIWHLDRTRQRMTYSVYVGEGDKSTWTPLYVFDDATMSYKGSTSVGDGAGELMILDKPGRPKNPSTFFSLQGDDKTKVRGNYHIVAGFCYNNTAYDRYDTDAYEFIGWQGFTCDGQSEFKTEHKERHYRFEDSVIHVNVTTEFTMDINDDQFEGQAMFPLPSQMKGNALFPNIKYTDWHNSGGELVVPAMRKGNSYTEDLRFDYVRYQYVARNNSYEVEPIQIRKKDNKLVIHSYGIYVCEENGTKWQFSKGREDEELVFNVKQFEYNGGQYQTYFPLPGQIGFPFTGGNGPEETSYSLSLYDDSLNNKANLSGLTVKAEESGGTWTIQFIKKTRANAGDANNHRILVESYGTYKWSAGAEWTKEKGFETLPDETDLKVNLFNLERDSKFYQLYFPLPTESDFPFKGSTRKIEDYKPVAYEMSDTYGEKAYKDTAYTVEYEKTGDIYKIEFVDRTPDNKYDPGNHQINVKSYGTYTWQEGAEKWTQAKGYYESKETDFQSNLSGLTVNGTDYRMYFPLPNESSFPFTGGVKDIQCTSAHVMYKLTDTYAANAEKLEYNYNVKHESDGNIHKITFYNRHTFIEYGTFQWQEGQTSWSKVTP